MSRPFTSYPKPYPVHATVSVVFTNQHFCRAIVVRKRCSPAFCGRDDDDLYPCSVCGQLFCEQHVSDCEGEYALCAHCAALTYDEQMRIIQLRKDLEHG